MEPLLNPSMHDDDATSQASALFTSENFIGRLRNKHILRRQRRLLPLMPRALATHIDMSVIEWRYRPRHNQPKSFYLGNPYAKKLVLAWYPEPEAQ